MTRDKVALMREQIIAKWSGMTPRERNAWMRTEIYAEGEVSE